MDFIFGFLVNTRKHFDYFSGVIELNSLTLISAPILLALYATSHSSLLKQTKMTRKNGYWFCRIQNV